MQKNGTAIAAITSMPATAPIAKILDQNLSDKNDLSPYFSTAVSIN